MTDRTAEQAPAAPAPAAATGPTPPNIADIEESLRDVVDPELGINVVDLGLIYGVTVDQHSHVVIDMTLTSAACPLTDVIEDQIAQPPDQLGLDAAVGPGQDHRRRPRAAEGPRLQRLSGSWFATRFKGARAGAANTQITCIVPMSGRPVFRVMWVIWRCRDPVDAFRLRGSSRRRARRQQPPSGTISRTTIKELPMAVTASEARKHLFPLIEKVNDDRTPIEITSRRGDAVLLSRADYDALEETAHLLRVPANAKRLIESLQQARTGQREEHDLTR
jgi:antitoxin YefM